MPRHKGGCVGGEGTGMIFLGSRRWRQSPYSETLTPGDLSWTPASEGTGRGDRGEQGKGNLGQFSCLGVMGSQMGRGALGLLISPGTGRLRTDTQTAGKGGLPGDGGCGTGLCPGTTTLLAHWRGAQVPKKFPHPTPNPSPRSRCLACPTPSQEVTEKGQERRGSEGPRTFFQPPSELVPLEAPSLLPIRCPHASFPWSRIISWSTELHAQAGLGPEP